MAKQDRDPPEWKPKMSDGCTMSLDRWGKVSFLPCCRKHDKAYHYGGSWIQKQLVDREFKRCIQETKCWTCKIIGWYRFYAVHWLGRGAWNEIGPGLPEEGKIDDGTYSLRNDFA